MSPKKAKEQKLATEKASNFSLQSELGMLIDQAHALHEANFPDEVCDSFAATSIAKDLFGQLTALGGHHYLMDL